MEKTSRGSILVNIGQFISRTFFFIQRICDKNKTVVANFFGNTNVFKWVTDLASSTESSVCNVYTY